MELMWLLIVKLISRIKKTSSNLDNMVHVVWSDCRKKDNCCWLRTATKTSITTHLCFTRTLWRRLRKLILHLKNMETQHCLLLIMDMLFLVSQRCRESNPFYRRNLIFLEKSARVRVVEVEVIVKVASSRLSYQDNRILLFHQLHRRDCTTVVALLMRKN